MLQYRTRREIMKGWWYVGIDMEGNLKLELGRPDGWIYGSVVSPPNTSLGFSTNTSHSPHIPLEPSSASPFHGTPQPLYG